MKINTALPLKAARSASCNNMYIFIHLKKVASKKKKIEKLKNTQ